MMGIDPSRRVQSAPPPYSLSQSRKTISTSKAQASRPPKGRRGRGQTDSGPGYKTKPNLPGPLSEIAAHLSHVPVNDTERFVNRLSAIRIEEARLKAAKRRKAIGRPMNAFMLYRKAYSERCKAYLGVESHQSISVGIGVSWKKESSAVKAQFNAWAKIEKTNHGIAFPEYKFQPKMTRRAKLTPSPSPRDWNDVGDSEGELDFHYTSPPKYRCTQSQEFSRWPSRPFDSYSTPFASGFNPTWAVATSCPSQRLPDNISTINPGLLHPTFDDGQYGAHGAQSITTEKPRGTNEVPGSNHEDHYQSSRLLPPSIGDGHTDTQLL